MSNMIELAGVSKSFGRQVAMDDVSFQVPEGCVFALLGENGAGKTTTIRTLLGLEKPDSGSVTVLGKSPVKEATSIRRSVGYVAERPVLYEWMKVSQIGWFNSGFYEGQYLNRFMAMLQEFEVPTDRKIKSLSKGMRAKVSLALAMSHDPDLLILDEPTSGLDPMVRRKFLESMVDLAAQGKSVFLSSHQISEVERVADWVAIMIGGKVLTCRPLAELKQKMELWVVSTEAHELPSLDARIVSQQWQGRRCRLLVEDPAPETLWRLRDHAATIDVEVHVPTLEDIFVGVANRTGDSAINDRSETANSENSP